MADFIVKDRTNSRFANDFQVDCDPAHVATDQEKAYTAAVEQTLAGLMSDLKADRDATLRDHLRTARNDWRAAITTRLRAAADEFAAARIDAGEASARNAKIETEYKSNIPDVNLTPVASPLFPGQVALTPTAFVPDAAEQAYLDELASLLEAFKTDDAADAAAKYSEDALAARRKQRTDCTSELKKDFANWKQGTDSQTVASNVSFNRGGYRALREHVGQSLFAVSVVLGTIGADKDYAVDLKIMVERDLPAPNDTASPEKQELFVQLNNACGIVRTVCQQIRDQAPDNDPVKFEAANKRARLLLDEYVTKLAGIGRLGLEGPHASLAKGALTSLKTEFVASQAGRIKNRYVRLLFNYALGFAAAFMAAYVFILLAGCPAGKAAAHAPACANSWWEIHKTFLLAATGAAAGTWVSFAIRRLDLPFEDLPLLEEASLDPPFRILFVVALTFTVCLLFWTSAVNIEIGNLKTGPESFRATGSIAFLIGMFCGLSERALATAVSGRAAAFVRGVAGAG
jgi:hypothetical protein